MNESKISKQKRVQKMSFVAACFFYGFFFVGFLSSDYELNFIICCTYSTANDFAFYYNKYCVQKKVSTLPNRNYKFELMLDNGTKKKQKEEWTSKIICLLMIDNTILLF